MKAADTVAGEPSYDVSGEDEGEGGLQRDGSMDEVEEVNDPS